MTEKVAPLITISQFSGTYSWPTECALRQYIHEAKKNGLEECFFRVGRRILIDPAKFFDQIRKMNTKEKKG